MNKTNTILDKYFDVLFKTGYLPLDTTITVLIKDFLDTLINDPDYLLYATCEQQETVCKLYNCIKRNCLFI